MLQNIRVWEFTQLRLIRIRQILRDNWGYLPTDDELINWLIDELERK